MGNRKDRYGAQHRAIRAATVAQATGGVCVRCGRVLGAGQAIQLDHADNGDPNAYLGYSHQRCNARAGAIRGNQLRAAAYRMLKAGLVVSAPAELEPPPAPSGRVW
jgi:hypothetical protein